MHDVRIAGTGDESLRRLRLTAGVDRRTRSPHRLRLDDELADVVVLPLVIELRRLPRAVDHVEPFGRSRITIVVLVELHAVATSLVGPPGAHDVERQTSVTDLVDVRRVLGEDGRL